MSVSVTQWVARASQLKYEYVSNVNPCIDTFWSLSWMDSCLILHCARWLFMATWGSHLPGCLISGAEDIIGGGGSGFNQPQFIELNATGLLRSRYWRYAFFIRHSWTWGLLLSYIEFCCFADRQPKRLSSDLKDCNLRLLLLQFFPYPAVLQRFWFYPNNLNTTLRLC